MNGDYTSIISREPMIHLLQKSDKSKTLESKLGKNQMVSSLVVEEEKESESSEIKIEKKGFDFSRVDET